MTLTPYIDTLSVRNLFVVPPEPSHADLMEAYSALRCANNKWISAFATHMPGADGLCVPAETRRQVRLMEDEAMRTIRAGGRYRNRMGYDLGGDCE